MSGRIGLLLAMCLQAGFVSAQSGLYTVDTRPPRGIMPASDQLSTPLDHIDTVNGKLHLEIPIASLPRGRGDSGFQLDLMYDSHLYDISKRVDSSPLPPYNPRYLEELAPVTATGGWTYNALNYRLELEERNPVTCDGYQRNWRARIALPDGSMHTLHLQGNANELESNYNGDGFYPYSPDGRIHPNCIPSPLANITGLLTYYTSDGSFLKLEIDANGPDWGSRTWKLYYPDGRRVIRNGADTPGEPFGSVYIYDANGNKIRIVHACYDPPPQGDCSLPYTTILDDSNREIRINRNITDAATNAPRKRDQIVAPGPNGNVTWTIDWMSLQIGGDGRTYQYTDSEPVGPPGNYELTNLYAVFDVIEYIHLPTTTTVPELGQPPAVPTSYAFGYSNNSDAGYGELDLVRTPAGSIYTYKWSLDGGSNYGTARTEKIAHENAVREKKITHTNGELVWTYSFGVTSSTITQPDGGTITSFFETKNAPHIYWNAGLVQRIEESHGAVRKREWAQNKPAGLNSVSNTNPNNPLHPARNRDRRRGRRPSNGGHRLSL